MTFLRKFKYNFLGRTQVTLSANNLVESFFLGAVDERKRGVNVIMRLVSLI